MKECPPITDMEMEHRGCHGGVVLWEFIISTVTQNCFPRCGFAIEDAVDIEKENQSNSDQVELQGKEVLDVPDCKQAVNEWNEDAATTIMSYSQSFCSILSAGLLDSIITSADVDKKIVKAMDVTQEFVLTNIRTL